MCGESRRPMNCYPQPTGALNNDVSFDFNIKSPAINEYELSYFNIGLCGE